MEEYPKKELPHIKSSCGTQSKISNPMGIGLGMDYVTWMNIQKWTPPTSDLHVGHKMQFPILWVQVWELTMSHGGVSKHESHPHQIFMWDTK